MRAHHAILAVALAALAVAGVRAQATPIYSAREGRTCDNCHLTPNTWDNPKQILNRKCTMSCQACHVDPNGGGMRTVGGRFFGRATLPMIAKSPRPTRDWDRWTGGFLYRRDRATTFTDSLPLGPNTLAESRDPAFAAHEATALGRPLLGPSRHAFFQGRYGALNADPLLHVSWDGRFATLLTQGAFAFPMQADIGATFHPIEHLTLVANVGARGRTGGLTSTVDDPRTPYLREGYVMLHEAPGQAYVRAGRFVPPFGLRLDDHTAATRRTMQIDGALPEVRVSGVEAGLDPNYPYLHVAWFERARRDRVPDAFDIMDVDGGSGVAADFGFREMGWSAGGSVWLENHDVADGGDARSYAVYGTFNPWFYRRTLPLVYQFEYDRGSWTRASGRSTDRAAFYHELDWQLGNGINLLVAQDFGDPDTEVKDDHTFRLSAGVQVTPIPGVTFDMRARGLALAGGGGGTDLFTQVHLWN